MAIAVKSGPMTAADELRTLLSRCEQRVVAPGGAEGVRELFGWLDQIAGLWPALQASGVDLRAEQVRWDSLQAAVRRRAPRLLREWQGPQSLVEARQAVQPDQSQWWWWIDQAVSQDRQRRLVKGLAITAAVVGVVLLGAFVLAKLFPVDPKVRETYRLQTEAETALMNGDLPKAGEFLRQAVAISPEDATLLITHGVVAEALGDQKTAEEAWAQARSLLGGDEARFLTSRGRSHLQVNQPQKAIEDELAALAIDPKSALAYYNLGGAYEMTGQTQPALDAYTKASELAGDSDPQLIVLARTRMGRLLQMIPYSGTATPEP